MFSYDYMYEECKHFGGRDHSISRQEWIKNWREVVCWERYYDYQIVDIENAVTAYCEHNNIPFAINGCWLCCASNRYHYNNIMKLIDEVLYGDYEED